MVDFRAPAGAQIGTLVGGTGLGAISTATGGTYPAPPSVTEIYVTSPLATCAAAVASRPPLSRPPVMVTTGGSV
jgi:hypothetical protein